MEAHEPLTLRVLVRAQISLPIKILLKGGYVTEFFNSIRQEITNNLNEDGNITSEIISKFQCCKCNQWFDKSDIANYFVPVSIGGASDIFKVKFICKNCYKGSSQ